MKRSISMFFPAYNEEKNIHKAIHSATKLLKEIADKYEIIIVVYEGCTDNTIRIVKDFQKKDKRIRLVLQPKHSKGVGDAMTIGLRNAKYPYIFYTDADNQFNIEEFKKFLPYVDSYDIIAGYRIKRQDSFSRLLSSKIYNRIVRAFYGIKERDLGCAFRMVKRGVMKNMKLISKSGLMSAELLARARKKGFKIKEIGVRHYPRNIGPSIFESEFLNLPKPKVIINLFKEMILLYKDLNSKK